MNETQNQDDYEGKEETDLSGSDIAISAVIVALGIGVCWLMVVYPLPYSLVGRIIDVVMLVSGAFVVDIVWLLIAVMVSAARGSNRKP
jgi:hypothetical protein